jgi:hypothetical protein
MPTEVKCPFPVSVIMTDSGALDEKATKVLFEKQLHEYKSVAAQNANTIRGHLQAIFAEAGGKPMYRDLLEFKLLQRMGVTDSNYTTLRAKLDEYLPRFVHGSRAGTQLIAPGESPPIRRSRRKGEEEEETGA